MARKDELGWKWQKRGKGVPAGGGLVRVIRLLCGEEVQALLVEGTAQQHGLSGHSPAALCGCQLALGLDALLGNALIQSHPQEALRVLHFAQDARHPVCHQIHHLQPPRSCVFTSQHQTCKDEMRWNFVLLHCTHHEVA